MNKIVMLVVFAFCLAGCGGGQTQAEEGHGQTNFSTPERPKGCACGVMPGVPDPNYQKCLAETGADANRGCPAAPSMAPSPTSNPPVLVHD